MRKPDARPEKPRWPNGRFERRPVMKPADLKVPDGGKVKRLRAFTAPFERPK